MAIDISADYVRRFPDERLLGSGQIAMSKVEIPGIAKLWPAKTVQPLIISLPYELHLDLVKTIFYLVLCIIISIFIILISISIAENLSLRRPMSLAFFLFISFICILMFSLSMFLLSYDLLRRGIPLVLTSGGLSGTRVGSYIPWEAVRSARPISGRYGYTAVELKLEPTYIQSHNDPMDQKILIHWKKDVQIRYIRVGRLRESSHVLTHTILALARNHGAQC